MINSKQELALEIYNQIINNDEIFEESQLKFRDYEGPRITTESIITYSTIDRTYLSKKTILEAFCTENSRGVLTFLCQPNPWLTELKSRNEIPSLPLISFGGEEHTTLKKYSHKPVAKKELGEKMSTSIPLEYLACLEFNPYNINKMQ